MGYFSVMLADQTERLSSMGLSVGFPSLSSPSRACAQQQTSRALYDGFKQLQLYNLGLMYITQRIYKSCKKAY